LTIFGVGLGTYQTKAERMRRFFDRLGLVAVVTLAGQAAAHADYIKVHEGAGKPGTAGVASVAPAPGDPPRIIYLHRKGGEFTSSDHDDSSMNLSGALHFGNPGVAEHVAAWNATDSVFKATLSCSQSMWGRFNVEVTDVDPGDKPHIEAVLTSSKNTALGFSGGTGGIALIDCAEPVIETAVVWIFPELFANNPQRTCEVIAQEVGHAMQLDHELLCKDPMTYLTDCEDRSFQDADAGCHDMSLHPAPCACTGRATQNSVRELFERLGPGETEAPTVVISAPAKNANVKPGFMVAAVGSDNYVVVRSEIWIDDALAATSPTATQAWQAPRTLAIGAHKIEVKVYDPAGNVGSDVVNVSIDGECTTGPDCGDGKVCTAGVCFGDLGTKCSGGEDCASGECAFDASNVQVCSKTCAAGGDCPSGFSCDRVGVSPVMHCLAAGESGGCALGDGGRGGGQSAPVGAALVTIAIFLGLRPKRRR
jgi:hypothetical protein